MKTVLIWAKRNSACHPVRQMAPTIVFGIIVLASFVAAVAFSLCVTAEHVTKYCLAAKIVALSTSILQTRKQVN